MAQIAGVGAVFANERRWFFKRQALHHNALDAAVGAGVFAVKRLAAARTEVDFQSFWLGRGRRRLRRLFGLRLGLASSPAFYRPALESFLVAPAIWAILNRSFGHADRVRNYLFAMAASAPAVAELLLGQNRAALGASVWKPADLCAANTAVSGFHSTLSF